MRNFQAIHYPVFDHLTKFKVSLLHEKTSETGKKYFVGRYARWLRDGIYAITNIGVEIVMYIQLFILKFLFSNNSTIQFNLKKTNKQERYFDETKKKSCNYCK